MNANILKAIEANCAKYTDTNGVVLYAAEEKDQDLTVFVHDPVGDQVIIIHKTVYTGQKGRYIRIKSSPTSYRRVYMTEFKKEGN